MASLVNIWPQYALCQWKLLSYITPRRWHHWLISVNVINDERTLFNTGREGGWWCTTIPPWVHDSNFNILFSSSGCETKLSLHQSTTYTNVTHMCNIFFTYTHPCTHVHCIVIRFVILLTSGDNIIECIMHIYRLGRQYGWVYIK